MSTVSDTNAEAAAAERLRTLLELSQALTSTLELDEVLGEFVRRAKELTYAASSTISEYDRERDALVTLVQVVDGAPVSVAADERLYQLADYPATRAVIESQAPMQVRAADESADLRERQLLAEEGYRSLLMLPLVGRGEVVGVMEVFAAEDREFEPDVVEFCQALCAIVGVALRNASLYAEMQRLATHDGLTGLANRALFEEQLAAAMARSDRSGEPLALLLVDLDALKLINDAWGHAAGDAALRALARALEAEVRAGDLACRLGGDEFAVILPGATRDEALKAAERVLERLADHGAYRVSGGVADYTPTDTVDSTSADLYRTADRTMYLAKRAGGGRIL